MIDKKVLKEVQEKKEFNHHDKVLIALSGGIDSMNLLDFLYRYRDDLEICLGLAHFNHKQRPESDREEIELSQLAKELGLPFYTAHFEGRFSESQARDQRYQFFKQIMETKGYTALVTAHHKDDQAETVFMRILRGSRLRHLKGMKRVQPFANGELIRPFLSISKSELANLPHFYDSSNATLDYLRNRIRNLYLPTLEKENPKLKQQLLNLSHEVSLLTEALDSLLASHTIEDIEWFQKQTYPIQYYLFQTYLEAIPDLQLTKAQFYDLLTMLRSDKNYYLPIKQDYYFIKNYGHFEIKKISPQTDSVKLPVLLDYKNSVQIGSYLYSYGTPLSQVDSVILLPSTTPIFIRERKAGDKILQGGVSKKVRRLFIDDKVALEDRQRALFLEQDHELMAILLPDKTYLRKASKDDIMKGKLYIQKLENW